MAVIDSAYQYYLSTYAGSGMSRYDTHKKSQLRAVYNNIVKVNKDSPLYKINFTRDTGRFPIDIKEQARSIENFIAALSNNAPDDNAEHAFSRKIAQSSDEDAVSVQYIGSNMDADNSKQFDITVERLATPQVNRGVYLAPGASDFVPGNYSFDLNTNLSSYEFQYTISGRDTNETVQRKIMRLINNANIGLNATLVSNDRGQNALSITSQQIILLKKIDVLCRNGSRQEHRCFEDGFLRVDFDAARAWIGGKECVLTPTEFRMLRYFTENAGVLLTYSVLLEKLWDSTGAYVDKHTLAVNVNRLRKKIEDEEHRYILNVYGIGYQWAEA